MFLSFAWAEQGWSFHKNPSPAPIFNQSLTRIKSPDAYEKLLGRSPPDLNEPRLGYRKIGGLPVRLEFPGRPRMVGGTV